ncbi:alpha/beta hydrolase [Sphingomonas sp. MMS24-J45]|uniref:alpha/beta hydrolase n=1 Tax=Sphingomonas sp. MMS24-J45 TaxID=3238806 RepID=UPI00384BA19A
MIRRLRSLAVLAALGALAACKPAAPAGNTAAPFVAPSRAMTLTAKDGVTIYARLYPAEQPKALILLFHQAGSSKDEYATIAPRLVAAGYSALAIDQRAGGALFGPNETAAHVAGKPTYRDAAPDLQAAIDWARTQGPPVIVWGSSYSSSLVFPLAADNPAVKAVLAFSPGEYFDDPKFVAAAAARVSIPVFVTSAPDAEEVAAARAIADAVPRGLATRYVPVAGVHGASTLIPARDPKGAETNWLPVLAFLKKVAP